MAWRIVGGVWQSVPLFRQELLILMHGEAKLEVIDGGSWLNQLSNLIHIYMLIYLLCNCQHYFENYNFCCCILKPPWITTCRRSSSRRKKKEGSLTNQDNIKQHINLSTHSNHSNHGKEKMLPGAGKILFIWISHSTLPHHPTWATHKGTTLGGKSQITICSHEEEGSSTQHNHTSPFRIKNENEIEEDLISDKCSQTETCRPEGRDSTLMKKELHHSLPGQIEDPLRAKVGHIPLLLTTSHPKDIRLGKNTSNLGRKNNNRKSRSQNNICLSKQVNPNTKNNNKTKKKWAWKKELITRMNKMERINRMKKNKNSLITMQFKKKWSHKLNKLEQWIMKSRKLGLLMICVLNSSLKIGYKLSNKIIKEMRKN